MGYPNFSELTFGFSFLSELQRYSWANSGIPFPWFWANFFTVHDEINIGADVEIFDGSIPVYIQLKRSEVFEKISPNGPMELIGTKKKHETGRHPALFVKSECPIYRMNLHRKHNYKQHEELRKTEYFTNGRACYVTSQVRDTEELRNFANSQLVMEDATVVYLPSEIQFSNFSEKHFVSFTRNRSKSLVYSELGEPFDRKHRNASVYIDKISGQNRAGFSAEFLKGEFSQIEGQLREAYQINELPEIYAKASVLWRTKYLLRYYLDTELLLI